MDKHRHLDYCVEPTCQAIIRFPFKRVRMWFYVCSAACLQKWQDRPEKEREAVVASLVKEGKPSGIELIRKEVIWRK